MRAGARTYKAALPGTVRVFFAVAALDSAAGVFGWDETCVFTFDGVRYAFPSNYSEWYKGGVIMSDYLRSIDSWDMLFE